MSVCGGCSLDGILAMFDFVSLREPVKAFSTLINLGYLGTADSALCISRGKRLELEEGKTERSVFQCFMFGPSHAGKSKLLNFFLGRGVSEGSTSTTAERFATVVVDVDEGTKKTLILRKISEEETGTFLSDKESLPACDIATFVFDRSTDESRDTALKMFKEVHNHCLNSGFGMFPCLLIEDQTDYSGFFTAHLLVEETSTDNVLFAPILPYTFQSVDHVGQIFLDIIRFATIQYQRDFRLSNTDMDEDQGRGGTSFVGRERSRSPLAHRIR